MGKHFKTVGARKALSIVLTMVMTVSMIPASVFADEEIKDLTETEFIEQTQPEIVPEDLPEEPEQEPEKESPDVDSSEEIEKITSEGTIETKQLNSSYYYSFEESPKSGAFDMSTRTYTITWKTGWSCWWIDIMSADGFIYATIWMPGVEGEYEFSMDSLSIHDNPSQEYVLVAYPSSSEPVRSHYFTITGSSIKFTSQPESQGVNHSTQKCHVTWKTNFAPKKVEIYKRGELVVLPEPVFGVSSYYEEILYDTLTENLSANGSYDFPIEEAGEYFFVKVYFDRDSEHLYSKLSEYFEVTANNLGFSIQPKDGFYDPTSGKYQVTWMTDFTPVRVTIYYLDEAGNTKVYKTLRDDLSNVGSYDIERNDARKKYIISAFYNEGHYVDSNWFTIDKPIPATSGSCGKYGSELKWSYYNHTLTISGNGYMADYASMDSQPWNDLRSQIKTVKIGEGVKSVGKNAFYSLLGLTSVYLPASLQSIGDGGFGYCFQLATVNCNFSEPDAANLSWNRNYNYTLFEAKWIYTYRAKGSCGTNLTWVVYGDNTLEITGYGDMDNWSSVTAVPWSDYRFDIVGVRFNLSGNTTIGSYAFSDLVKLESITLDSKITSLGSDAFYGAGLKTITIQNQSLNIPDNCFRRCESLQSITIPKNATSIGSYAFLECSTLKNVTFPSGSALKTIGKYAFYECKKLGNVSFPSGVTSIGSYAFSGCRYFTSLTLPSSLTSLGSYAFQNCKNITGTVTIPSSVSTIPSHCFADCSRISVLDIAPMVTSIGTSAFENCTNLATINYSGFRTQWGKISIGSGNSVLNSARINYLYVEGNLTSDVYYTIDGRSGRLNISGSGSISTGYLQKPWYQYAAYIETIDIDGSIVSIGSDNFRNCTIVKMVYLPGSVNTIGARAFQDCALLEHVYFDGTSPAWEDVSIGAGNTPLYNANIHCTGSIGGSIRGCDMYWDFDDVDTLTIYFDMDAGETEMPDFQDDREQPWYEYQSRIKHLIISEGVTYLGNENFSCLSNLEDIVFPSSIERMGSGVFSYCSKLEDVVLPDSVESITASTFWSCGNLNSVKLPSNLKTIPASMFYNSGTLNRVYIPSTVTSIEFNAFTDCTDLSDIYFDGTSVQWSKISIASGNDKLNSVNIHFVVPELAINEKNFPDANFRAYIKEKFDTDKTGFLTDAERLAVKEIWCSGKNIGSVKGIENFPNLEKLDCSDNGLHGELELGDNVNLVEVYCGDNDGLDYVLVDGLTDLEILDCHHDINLSPLDLSTNYALRKLDVSSCELSSLDVSKNAELIELKCNYNNLSKLDLSRNLILFRLYCYTNNLTTLDLSHCPFLQEVDCADNDLTLLYLGELRELCVLRAEMNAFLTLDVADCQKIRNCVRNSDTNVQYIEGMVSYELDNCVLTVDDDVLVISDFSGIYINEANFPDPVFREYVSMNVDIDKNGRLIPLELEKVTKLELSDGDITNLKGIEHFPKLKTLSVWFSMDLTDLDLSRNVELECLELTASGVEELDLRENRCLKSLFCEDTPLRSLNVFGLTELEYIDISGCTLTELDVSDCPLTDLICYDSDLQSLVLGEQPELKNLKCHNCDIAKLNISRCSILADAWLNGQHTLKGGQYYEVKDAPLGGYLTVDNDAEVITEQEGVAITKENFPDKAFRAYVEEKFDTDKNGWLNDAEIAETTSIDVHGESITDLKGIEFFGSMTSLNVSNNNLTYLDLRSNPELLYLTCYNNNFVILNLTANKKLKLLEADRMESLKGVFVSGLTHLTYIDVSSCDISVLDVSSCPLKYLECDHNPLASLILGKQPDLDSLMCFSVDLTELDISECPHLVNAWLNGEHTEYEWGLAVSLEEEGYMEIDSSLTVTLPAFVEITSQPESISGQVGEEKTMSVIANNATSYQWQRSTDGEEWKDITTTNVNYKGAQEDTLTVKISKTTAAYRYRCVVANEYGFVPSEIATVTSIVFELQITSQPNSIFGQNGEEKTMSVVAPGATSYQWQRSTDGVNWTKISTTNTNYKDAKTDTLTIKISKTTAAYEYRCMVANDNSSVASNPASVTVMEIIIIQGPEITTQPADVTGEAGEEKTMSVVATNATSYQWQRSADGEAWSNISSTNKNYTGAKTAELTIKISKTTASFTYRCVAKNDSDSVPSNAAAVTLITSQDINITSQPENITGQLGEEKTMQVVAENATSYQWQRCSDGENWSNISSTNVNYKDAKTSTLTIKISKTTASYQYRCMVKNDTDSVPSDPASVTVAESAQLPVITTQPAEVIGEAGEEKTMSVVASNAASYQWQRSADGENWSNISSTNVNYKDAKTSTLTIKISKTTASYQYRCVVKNDNGSVPSEAASVTIGNVFEITVQPESITAQIGEEKTMSVVAENAVSYQWQRSADGENWSSISETNVNYSGAKTDTLTVKISKTTSSYVYRCIVKNEAGDKDISSIAEVSIATPEQ